MDIKELRQLIRAMVENDLTEVNIEDGDKKVFLKRGVEGQPVIVAPQAIPASAPAAAVAAPAPAAEEPVSDLIDIPSPMVGTFYSASSPDSDAYVSVGDKIGGETLVCIIEAMKVMNEIKAECSGTIAEICIENAQPVEFGQVLFRVKPN